jgi:hypothetical protein
MPRFASFKLSMLLISENLVSGHVKEEVRHGRESSFAPGPRMIRWPTGGSNPADILRSVSGIRCRARMSGVEGTAKDWSSCPLMRLKSHSVWTFAMEVVFFGIGMR